MRRWLVVVVLLVGCGSPDDFRERPSLPPITIDAVMPSPPPTIAPARVSYPAVRPMLFMQITETLPPPSTADGPSWAHCPQWWSEARDVGWAEYDLANMDRIMYRESRCQPGVHNSAGANGLMQIMSMWADDCGGTVTLLRTAVFNLACALHVLHVQGWAAWSTS